MAHFFDLPQEIRDMIYAYFPYQASIHINQDPIKLLQPNISEVSRLGREESLNVFYGRNKFVLDLRGWKDSSYPRRWSPFDIFNHWITAIGDENTARLRHLTFISHDFRVVIKISNDVRPSFGLKVRTNTAKAEVADQIPKWYTYSIAASRVEQGLIEGFKHLNSESGKGALTVADFLALSSAVQYAQPFLCKRPTLGYAGAVLLEDDMSIGDWPSAAHLKKCDDCGYHRYMRD